MGLLGEYVAQDFSKFKMYTEKLESTEFSWMKKVYKIYKAMLLME